MKIYKLINSTFRYFWSKAVGRLEQQLRYPQQTLEWKSAKIPKSLEKIPLTISCKKPLIKYDKVVLCNVKNVTGIGHPMSLRSRSKKVSGSDAVAALDPGIRTFQTLYDSNNHIVEFGIQDVYMLDSKKIPEIHEKIACYLLDTYKIILIPRLVLTNNPGRFNDTWKHSEFVDLLLQKAKRSNSTVIEVEEAYTSQTCSRCGVVTPPGASKTFRCGSCKLVIDRDINGARNILLKNMNHLGIEFKTQ